MKEIIFDEFYEGYDEWYKTKMGKFVDQIETDLLFNCLNPKPGMKILDIGCGTGNISYKLAKLGCQVVGIDISKKMLDKAKSKYKGESVDFYNMSSYNIDFSDIYFDAAISMTAFEFIYDPKRAYEEIKRVTKNNGSIIIGTIQKGGEWQEFYSSNIFKGTAYEKARFKTGEEIEKLDKNSFVKKEECLYISPTVKEDEFNLENELIEKEKGKIGGFVCVKFKKKN